MGSGATLRIEGVGGGATPHIVGWVVVPYYALRGWVVGATLHIEVWVVVPHYALRCGWWCHITH